MIDLHARGEGAKQFATDHLAECASELLAWPETQLPVDGRVRELSRMIGKTDGNNGALMLAVELVNRLTREAAVAASPDRALRQVTHEESKRMSDSAKPEGSAAADGTKSLAADELSTIRAACNAQIHAWSEVRDQHPGMLIGKRVIVLDERGRAYGSLPDGRYKLEYPRSNLVGVSHFNNVAARDLAQRLESALPQFAPYAVIDCKAYAKKRIEEARHALRLVEARNDALTVDAPLPAGLKTWVVTAASGEFVVNADTGAVLSYSVYPGADDPLDFRERAQKIDRFNVAEYRQWFESVGLEEPTNLNWLGIGFWQKDGHYEPFEQDWRDDLVEAQRSNDAATETPEP